MSRVRNRNVFDAREFKLGLGISIEVIYGTERAVPCISRPADLWHLVARLHTDGYR